MWTEDMILLVEVTNIQHLVEVWEENSVEGIIYKSMNE